MNNLAMIVGWMLVGLALAQALLACGYVWILHRRRRDLLADDACPKAAVILCLRGADPFLPNCLQALLNQDYPHYDLHVVVDHPDDPAWSIVEDVVKQCHATPIHLQPLRDHRLTCSLKCSSLVQAISSLDDAYDVIVQVDADTIPHRQWLRELVTPLADEQVGASTGSRWYMASESSWGTMVRYAWNAAAVVPMYWGRIAWGGTLAIKAQVFRDSDLLHRWGHAFCEDTMINTCLRRQGLRLAFVPALMMVNRETCSLSALFPWICRQLLTTRLYHRSWWGIVGHGLCTTILLIMSLGILVVALLTRDWEAAAWAGGGFVGYEAMMVLLLILLEAAVRQVVRDRGEPTAWLTRAALTRYLPAIPLAQGLYAAVLIKTMFMRTVEWRGIVYHIEGAGRIRLLEYLPYRRRHPSSDSISSL